MNSLKENKAFQTIVGAAVLYVGFVLWRDGWISWLLSSEPQDGYSNGQLLVALGGALLSFVQLVGIATIGIVSGILPQFDGLFDWVAKGIKDGTEWLKKKAQERKDKPAPRDGKAEWDWRPIAAIVLGFVLWNNGQLGRIGEWLRNLIPAVVVEDDKPKGVVWFVGDDADPKQLDVASSVLVDDALDSAGVERRLYSLDQDLSNEEDWVAEARDRCSGGSCLVYWDGSRFKEVSPPTSVSGFVGEIKSW